MPTELVIRTLRKRDFSQIDWQKELIKFSPDQLFKLTVIEAEDEQAKKLQTASDNIVEIDGKEYELDMSPDLPMAEINANLAGFDFLKDEPDLYSIDDLKKPYV